MCTESEGWVLANMGAGTMEPSCDGADAGEVLYCDPHDIGRGGDQSLFWRCGQRGRRFRDTGRISAPTGTPVGVILVFDEAQTLRKISAQVEMEETSTLKAIHDGLLGAPVVLLTAGLGITKIVDKKMGVSRFKGGCVHQIEALGLQEEQAVIRDWLTIEQLRNAGELYQQDINPQSRPT